VRAVTEAGGVNFIHARFVQEVAELVMHDPPESVISVQPTIRVGDSEAWGRAFRLAIAYLNRFKMNQTSGTVKMEFPETPKSTGYTRASGVDAAFHDLLEVIEDLEQVPFDEKVDAFVHELDAHLSERAVPMSPGKRCSPSRKGSPSRASPPTKK
jgi:uncharacterized protein (DUF58 family)